MRRIFWGFCRIWFLMSPRHYLSIRSDFDFEFADIFVIEKRFPDSPSWGVRKFNIALVVDLELKKLNIFCC
jgi:hypothetical protein